MDARYPTLIASPQVSFGELGRQLAALGWELESASSEPILAGEPELAVFVLREDATSIHYTFNPVVMLRVLQFRGENAKVQCRQAARRIAVLALDDLRKLLDSRNTKQLLLGLLAADELSQIGVLDQVEALCTHGDARVARTASRVRDSLTTQVVQQVTHQFAAEQASHSERSAWVSHLPQPELRKQVLRWMMRGSQESNRSIDQVLHSALKDADPEVRVTAVLAAAKLKATNLIAAIRDVNIPTSSRHGADERDRFFYERLRQTTVGYLSMGDRAKNQQAEEKRFQFQKAVSGEVEIHDDPTLLLHSLVTPVQLGEKPPRLPTGVEERDGGYYLHGCGLTLRWISPVPHWLGEDSARAPLPNPIRRVTPEAGFFIAESPVHAGLARWTSDPTPSPFFEHPLDKELFVCGYNEAEHLCEVLGKIEGIRLELPTADQWEMAARGPDGRRYPWGNSLREDGPLQPSPWMVKNLVGGEPAWTLDQKGEASHIVCGGSAVLVCARREAVIGHGEGMRCTVRPVINWSGQ